MNYYTKLILCIFLFFICFIILSFISTKEGLVSFGSYSFDKYYGNLSIQEYRSLLKSERLFLIVDKPLTRILPEFHEDNDEFIIHNKIIPSNTYQVKKKIQKGVIQTKNNIVNEKFGISSVN